MYYRTFVEQSVTAIAVATSSDGDTWTAYDAGRAVLDIGAAGSSDSYANYAPSVWFDGATFWMLYEGWCGDCGHNQVVMLASSTDGYSWTKYGDFLSPEQDWEAGNTGTPSLNPSHSSRFLPPGQRRARWLSERPDLIGGVQTGTDRHTYPAG